MGNLLAKNKNLDLDLDHSNWWKERRSNGCELPWKGQAIEIHLFTYLEKVCQTTIITLGRISKNKFITSVQSFNELVRGYVRTSLWSDMKHEISSPPMEWDIKFTFLPPEALLAVSNFALRPSIALPILTLRTINVPISIFIHPNNKKFAVPKTTLATWNYNKLIEEEWFTDYSAESHNQNQTMWFPSCTHIQQAYQSYHENDTHHPHGGIWPSGTVKGKLKRRKAIGARYSPKVQANRVNTKKVLQWVHKRGKNLGKEHQIETMKPTKSKTSKVVLHL